MSRQIEVSELIDAMAMLANAFRQNQVEPPEAILLSSHKEGIRFLSYLRQQQNWMATPGSTDLGKPVELLDGRVWMSVKYMGIEIRWPAQRYELPDGSRRFA